MSSTHTVTPRSTESGGTRVTVLVGAVRLLDNALNATQDARARRTMGEVRQVRGAILSLQV